MAEQKGTKTSEKGKELQRSTALPISPLEEMDQIMDRMMSNFFPFSRPFNATRWPVRAEWAPQAPRVDVIDRDEDLLVRAELPGVKKEDLDVTVRDNAITIKATNAWEKEEEKGDYYRREVSRGEFYRSLPLPAEVDGEKAKANFKDGILELTLPKAERAKGRRLNIE